MRWPARWLKLGRVSRLLIGAAGAFCALALFLEYRIVTRPQRMRQRISDIRDERLALGRSHPWAGRYSTGRGLGGQELELAPEAGFVETHWGDAGPWSIARAGSVREENGVLVMRHAPLGLFEKDRYIPLRWGDRHYLIPEGKLPEFANAINNGWEPGETNASFLIRGGDAHLPVTGDAHLPDTVRRLLLAKPIKARIISVRDVQLTTTTYPGGSWVEGSSTVTLDAGSREGVLVDLILNGDFESCWKARVTRVESARSEAACSGNMSRVPVVGDVLEAGAGLATPKDSLRIRLSGVPPGIKAVADASRIWGWDAGAARKAGFVVRDMGRLSADLPVGMGESDFAWERIRSRAAAAGANVIVDSRVRRGSDYGVHARLYRVERKGIPLKAVQVPVPSRRMPDFKKEYPADWDRAREEVDLDRLMDSETYARRANEIYERHMGELMHWGPLSYEQWLQTDVRDLTRAQREALRKYMGVEDEWGTVSETLSRNHRQDRSREAAMDASDAELKALQASEPASYSRYTKLHARRMKLYADSR
jgi:hypothetical protein